MAGPADPISDPVYVLTACLQERSGGSMIAALRDVWQMACRKGYTGSYEEARRLLAATGRYSLVDDFGNPVMIRPAT